jgi:chemotaxis signal transduction protein
MQDIQNNKPPSSANLKEESQLVTFLLKDEEFGFDIMSVQEIIRLPKMARVPRTPDYVDGIANLRGVVLPVIDMRTRFGMERAAETDRTRVLVIDIDGVKTGLRVDLVKQVTRVLRSEIEPPSSAIRGTSADYLEGVVKLDQGQRIVMALNAAQVCEIEIDGKTAAAQELTSTFDSALRADTTLNLKTAETEVQKLVTFRIAKEEFAFHMEHVREILRVQTPKQVPDVPDYVLGVLTVRGQILPVIDLRRLLQQRPLADELAAGCRPLRELYEHWVEAEEKSLSAGSHSKVGTSAIEDLRKWLAATTFSSQILMEASAKARALNEKVLKQLQARGRYEENDDREAAQAAGAEMISAALDTVAALCRMEQQIPENIQEDQRIIVVDSEGFVLGLVVDHVHEVLNVPKKLMEPPPRITSTGGTELAGVAKLDEGSRLIMLLEVAHLMKDQKLREVQASSYQPLEEKAREEQKSGSQELSEMQLVTFMLGAEEFGVPISQIQEIDRLGKITKVPKAADFIEGITNLRGEVIPVLDTRKRFALESKLSDDRTRIIIVDLGGVKTGLVVDSVREVLNLPTKDIAPPPSAIRSGIDQQFISGIGKVDAGKRMIVLLDVERILSQQEQTRLRDVAA